MTPTGAISGRILNRYGEPVGNANVQALRYTYQEGRRTLTPIQTTRSNDLGEYRLFWMTPGQYVISAQPVDALGVDPGGTIFFQGVRGGGPALAAGLGAQLGVGGVTQFSECPAAPGGFSRRCSAPAAPAAHLLRIRRASTIRVCLFPFTIPAQRTSRLLPLLMSAPAEMSAAST